MGIPIGKLSLYIAGAGLHPDLTLPVSLDCGTDNADLLDDPFYLGYPKPRLRGSEYDAFIEAFVRAVQSVYPGAVLQWEDFKQHNALRLLERYRHRIPSFNDDIQGTAAVVLAGIQAAVRHKHERLRDQRVVFLGAGAAGIGIARLLQLAMRAEGATEDQLRRAVVMVDSKGLVFEGREGVDEDKRPFALSRSELARLGFDTEDAHALERIVARVAPTVLVGTSGQPGAFSQTTVRQMAAATERPVVMPLSNPTAKSEATPADVLAWTDGRSLVATGSPFAPVPSDHGDRVIGQANNVFIFPGVGLGSVVAGSRELTDEMFLVAASTLASMVTDSRLEQGALYPPLSDLRSVSRQIAINVAREACRQDLSRLSDEAGVERAVEDAIWFPRYPGSSPI